MNYYVTDIVLLSLLSSCVLLQVLSNISIIIFSVQSIGILLTIRNKIINVKSTRGLFRLVPSIPKKLLFFIKLTISSYPTVVSCFI